MNAMLDRIVPTGVVAVDTTTEVPLPEVTHLVGSASPGRQREFATARWCAMRALATLGLSPQPVLRTETGEPRWPLGIVGSITHCHGYRAAVVARATNYASIGTDAEPHEPLPRGLIDRVALPSERRWIETHTAGEVCWGRVLFSAKESIYKAWYPLARRWLGFHDAEVRFSPDTGRFRAQLRVVGPEIGRSRVTGFDGRFGVMNGYVLTFASYPTVAAR